MSDAKTILIVDDEPDTVMVLKDRLEMEGYQVMTATDGVEALEALQKTKPDFILLDVMMPRMNGYQTCRKIKNQSEWAKIPILLVTAKTQESDKYWGQESGCDGYVTKPFEMETIIEKIKTHLQK